MTLRRVSVAGTLSATALTLVLLASAPAEGRLPASPFELSVLPSSLRVGEPATIRIELAGGTAAGRTAGERYDLYVVWLLRTEAAYLAPTGVWSAQPVPYRRSVSPSGFTGIEDRWRIGPAGWMSLALVTVKHGGRPPARENWQFRPSVRWVRVIPAPSPADDPPPVDRMIVLSGLAIAALAAAACLHLDQRLAGPASEPPSKRAGEEGG